MNRIRIIAKRAKLIVPGALAILICIMSWNYWRFSSRQIRLSPIAMLSLDNMPILGRLHGAIEISTVTTEMSRLANDSELYRFRDYLEESFPRLHTPPFVRRTGKDFGDAEHWIANMA
jgi:hypothetical protein